VAVGLVHDQRKTAATFIGALSDGQFARFRQEVRSCTLSRRRSGVPGMVILALANSVVLTRHPMGTRCQAASP
jgi:hypothetical protein